MYEQVNKPKKNKSRVLSNYVAQKKTNVMESLGSVDSRNIKNGKIQVKKEMTLNIDVYSFFLLLPSGKKIHFLTHRPSLYMLALNMAKIHASGTQTEKRTISNGGAKRDFDNLIENADYHYCETNVGQTGVRKKSYKRNHANTYYFDGSGLAHKNAEMPLHLSEKIKELNQ